jgi:membrane fusion protein, copper/silver efflux system
MKTKNIVIALAAIAVFGAAGAALYRAGMERGAQTAAAQEKKPLYWHDPMVPGQKFDKPGKSPFMDMQLVPVYAGEAGDEGKVTISPRVQQNLGMRTAKVTSGRLASTLAAVGSVAYNERDVALVQARSGGFIERLHVRAPLDRVRKGQALLELYSPDWIAAQEDYLAARRMQGSGAEGLAGASRERMRLAGMDEGHIRLVERTGKVHPRVAVTAPIGGVVAELSVREGMTVAAGAPLFRINGVASVWINAEVPEAAAARLRPGSPAEARTPAMPGAVFKGTISAIVPEVNAATRTLKARIEIANPKGALAPGMFANLSFPLAAGRDALLVPSEAVIETGTRSVVMLALGEGRFAPVDVETGAESNGSTEIRKGLEAGQEVVVSGQFLIDSEASLKRAAK